MSKMAGAQEVQNLLQGLMSADNDVRTEAEVIFYLFFHFTV